MGDELILVTGAAGGRQGKTGRHVSDLLLDKGHRVRAFVHQMDERDEPLRARGAELCQGDLLDYDSVERAVRGVTAVYFAYPVQEGLLEATAIMAAAARKAGVSRLVNLVMLESSTRAPTPRMRQNFFSEQIFEWAGLGVVHIRATVFYENVREHVRAALAAGAPMRLPWGNDRTLLPLVAGEDVAKVAAGMLVGPPQPAGTALRVIGELLAVRDIVLALGRVLGRDLRYEPVPVEAWREQAESKGLNAHAVEHLSRLWQFFGALSPDDAARLYRVPDTIERFGGTRPKTLEQFFRQEQEELAAASASAGTDSHAP